MTQTDYERLQSKLSALEKEIERAKNEWFFLGVLSGICGIYLGRMLGIN